MTNDELGRRAVACKHWRWMPGMLDLDGWRLIRQLNDEGRPDWLVASPNNNRDFNHLREDEIAYPDLTDPVTMGCLLHLVRKAWKGQYTVCGEAQLTAEALVAALEGTCQRPRG